MWWTGDRRLLWLSVVRIPRVSLVRNDLEGFGGGREVGQSAEQSWSGAAQGRAGQAMVLESKTVKSRLLAWAAASKNPLLGRSGRT